MTKYPGSLHNHTQYSNLRLRDCIIKEKDLIEYKELLEKYRSYDGKTYKYTLPQAMDEISRLEKESKMYNENADNWKKLAQEEIRMQRRLTRKLVELGVTDKELEDITGHENI